MAKRLIDDTADIPPTHRVCVLPWRVFGQFPEGQKTTIVAVAAALSAVQGLEQKCTTTAVAIAMMVGKNEREVRDAFWALSRSNLWTRGQRINRAFEWWVNVGQMALFSDSQPGTGPGREPAEWAQPGTGPGRDISEPGTGPGREPAEWAQPGTGPGRESGRIRNSTNCCDEQLLSFLKNKIDDLSAADAAMIAGHRDLEWALEWVSLWPYYPKPIRNEARFLIDADAESWKYPRSYQARRDRDLAEKRQLELRRNELTERRPAGAAEPEMMMTPEEKAERTRAAIAAARASVFSKYASGGTTN